MKIGKTYKLNQMTLALLKYKELTSINSKGVPPSNGHGQFILQGFPGSYLRLGNRIRTQLLPFTSDPADMLLMGHRHVKHPYLQGPVIIYGEGGRPNGKIGGPTLFASPPSRQDQTFCARPPPPFKE